MINESSFKKYDLIWAANTEVQAVLLALGSSIKGLDSKEAKKRLIKFGFNKVASESQPSLLKRFIKNLKDPLSLLLLLLAIISYFTGDNKATIIILVMLFLSISLRFWQELKADQAASRLRALVSTTATVWRNGKKHETSLKSLVPGDIITLSAGDMIPADVRLIESKDLFVNQSSLTGESLPTEKHASLILNGQTLLEKQNICLMGTGVESGTATAVVVRTGRQTYFGTLASSVIEQAEISSFDKGIKKFTWLMIRLIAIMVPLVFLINGFGKGDWAQAFLFSLSVAVGLTPELLPMIVTVNLSKGALDMSRRKVIVKRLNAIQNLGAMDILCTDKTGTITQGKVTLVKYVDIMGRDSEIVLDYGYLNSINQTGLKNVLDEAIVTHKSQQKTDIFADYNKIDEVPFDFKRRRLSIVVTDKSKHILICKGAVEEVIQLCSRVIIDNKEIAFNRAYSQQCIKLATDLEKEGFRLIAVAKREFSTNRQIYTAADEKNLSLLGFLAFLDPPKKTTALALAELAKYGVVVKVLTGDNELVAKKICSQVGLSTEHVLSGAEVEKMNDESLVLVAAKTVIFSKLEPKHKQRIIKALQNSGHVVGFLGDGINDAPALKTADVGISVDTGTDIAKESSDIVLLEKNLLVLKEGVLDGRRVFGNIVKYIEMAASSNFGNMFSVIGASVFLPFLPMLPLQILVNNLLYDFSQTTIPTDKVDNEYLLKPRQWHINHIKKFILFLGPVSSFFDYLTFALMLFVFNAWTNPALFQTGWFVESLLTQTLIIHVIRTRKIPFIQSRASWPLLISTILVITLGIWLPYSPLGDVLGFVKLPSLFWPFIIGIILAYFVLTQLIKRLFIRLYNWY